MLALFGTPLTSPMSHLTLFLHRPDASISAQMARQTESALIANFGSGLATESFGQLVHTGAVKIGCFFGQRISPIMRRQEHSRC